ncbi:hypothetical protein MORE_10580 [Moorella thermoacetica]|nr:hypothetical protein MORE_10580 [Moorella thermoacetica]
MTGTTRALNQVTRQQLEKKICSQRRLPAHWQCPAFLAGLQSPGRFLTAYIGRGHPVQKAQQPRDAVVALFVHPALSPPGYSPEHRPAFLKGGGKGGFCTVSLGHKWLVFCNRIDYRHDGCHYRRLPNGPFCRGDNICAACLSLPPGITWSIKESNEKSSP